MAAPEGQNKLPLQTPNSSQPIVMIQDADVSTQLKDSLGKPCTGKLQLFGNITPAWRYLLGRFLTSALSATGTTTINDPAVWNDTAGTSLKDITWAAATALMSLFTSTLQGVVPASGGGTTNFLRADGTWAPVTAPGSNYLGTVSVAAGALSDTTLLGSGSFRSYQLVVKNIVPGTNAVRLSLQVHSGGTFQTTTYLANSFQVVAGGSLVAAAITTGIPFCSTSIANAAPGFSGEIEVSNLSGTSEPKIFHGRGGFNASAAIGTSAFSGYWNGGNGAIDGFQIIASTGTLTSGSVDVYGLT